MLYVSEIRQDGMCLVTDTKDGVVDLIDRESLLFYTRKGLKVHGVSECGSLVYPVKPKSSRTTVYVGTKIAKPIYNVFITFKDVNMYINFNPNNHRVVRDDAIATYYDALTNKFITSQFQIQSYKGIQHKCLFEARLTLFADGKPFTQDCVCFLTACVFGRYLSVLLDNVSNAEALNLLTKPREYIPYLDLNGTCLISATIRGNAMKVVYAHLGSSEYSQNCYIEGLKNSACFATLEGVYIFDYDCYLDSIGLGEASFEQSKSIVRTKLVTGNTDISITTNGTVFGVHPDRQGWLMLPDKGVALGKHSLHFTEDVTGMRVPSTYKRVDVRAIDGQGDKLSSSFTLATNAVSSVFISSFLVCCSNSVLYRKYNETFSKFKINTGTHEASMATALGLLTLPSDALHLLHRELGVFNGVCEFLVSVPDTEMTKVCNKIWDTYLDSSVIIDIKFKNVTVQGHIQGLNVPDILELRPKMVSVFNIVNLLRGIDLDKNSVLSQYINRVLGLMVSYRDKIVNMARSRGFCRNDIIKIPVSYNKTTDDLLHGR